MRWKRHQLIILLTVLYNQGCSSIASEICDNLDSCKVETENTTTTNDVCGIWFAPSSIPNSGLGMYAGRNFDEGEEMMATGDAVIPIVDMVLHQGTKWFFLWDSYTWNSASLQMANDGINDVSVASPGFGSAANSFLDLQNVEEWSVEHSLAGLHRRKDPGAGAFTPYYNRKSTAKVSIPMGQELFVSYGSSWFLERTLTLGPIPIKGDLPKANKLIKNWDYMRQRNFNDTNEVVWKDILETFLWKSPFQDTSRLLFSLPKTLEETEQVVTNGLVKHRKQQSTRSLEWLKRHGTCGDNIREGLSEIPQAGRGAFATRNLAQNSIVAPLPLIHVPYRKRLDMYETNVKTRTVTDKSRKLGQQLILNYCFGHSQSTMLLCPYGLLTSFINHGKEPNVELRWSDVTRSAHSPEWLNKTVKDFTKQKFAVLTMEIVALRDIAKDEEILLDYGDEWQQAWDKHVRHWQPLEGAESYISADELNQNVTTSSSTKLKTVFEQIENPYPSNLELKFDLAFRERSDWIHHLEEGTLTKYRLEAGEELAYCDILRSSLGKDDQYYYDIVYTYVDDEEEEENIKLTDIPREAFVFKDKPYTADFLQKHVFRHDIRIPDKIFPDSWRNIRESEDTED